MLAYIPYMDPMGHGKINEPIKLRWTRTDTEHDSDKLF